MQLLGECLQSGRDAAGRVLCAQLSGGDVERRAGVAGEDRAGVLHGPDVAPGDLARFPGGQCRRVVGGEGRRFADLPLHRPV